MKIIELELNSQPSTPLEIREQGEAFVKDGVAIVNAAVADCTVHFEQEIEVVTNLQEDLTL